MSDNPSVDAVTAISAILAKHQTWDFSGYGVGKCQCGVAFWHSSTDRPALDAFNAHVAVSLASHMAGAQAEAWTAGHLDVCNDCVCPPTRNPFTADTGNTE